MSSRVEPVARSPTDADEQPTVNEATARPRSATVVRLWRIPSMTSQSGSRFQGAIATDCTARYAAWRVVVLTLQPRPVWRGVGVPRLLV